MVTNSTPRNLSDLSLRSRERGLVVGGTGSGKSTLSEYLLTDFRNRYSESRVLLLDSKPRFRAEYTLDGRSARRRYKNWSHGPTVPGSVAVNSPQDMRSAWKLLGGRGVVIAQGERDQDVTMLTECVEEFLRDASARRHQLVMVDELLDFFTPGAQEKRGTKDSLRRVVRAGRERGVGALYCSQRTKGIPVNIIAELTKLYLFHIEFEQDVDRLRECGYPRTDMTARPPVMADPPAEDHEFRYWTKAHRRQVYGPFRLALS